MSVLRAKRKTYPPIELFRFSGRRWNRRGRRSALAKHQPASGSGSDSSFPSARAIANDPPECTRECGLIGKARLQSDISYRKIAGHQQHFRVVNPAFKKPAIGGHAEALPERVREVAHRQ